MFQSRGIAVLLACAAAGCSTVEKLQPDDTPLNPTAILETHVVNNGLKGFFPYEGSSRTYTRADMQREDDNNKGTGTFTRFIIGSNDDSRIVRLDRKIVWTMDAKEKTYTECPLKGCTGPVAEKPKPEKKPEEPKKAEKPGEPDCRMKIAKTVFTVKPTGQKRSINAFDTEQYQVAWVVTLQDPKKRQTVSNLSVDVWTTPYSQPLKDAMAVEAAYAKSFATALAKAASAGQKTQVVPEQAAQLINGYLSQIMSPADKTAFMKAGKELEKIKGYPILTELSWNMQGDACAGEQPKPTDDAPATPASNDSLLSSVTSFFTKKKTDEMAKDIADKPILSFSVEVKAHKLEPAHDSVFSPPKNYKKAGAGG